MEMTGAILLLSFLYKEVNKGRRNIKKESKKKMQGKERRKIEKESKERQKEEKYKKWSNEQRKKEEEINQVNTNALFTWVSNNFSLFTLNKQIYFLFSYLLNGRINLRFYRLMNFFSFFSYIFFPSESKKTFFFLLLIKICSYGSLSLSSSSIASHRRQPSLVIVAAIIITIDHCPSSIIVDHRQSQVTVGCPLSLPPSITPPPPPVVGCRSLDRRQSSAAIDCRLLLVIGYRRSSSITISHKLSSTAVGRWPSPTVVS